MSILGTQLIRTEHPLKETHKSAGNGEYTSLVNLECSLRELYNAEDGVNFNTHSPQESEPGHGGTVFEIQTKDSTFLVSVPGPFWLAGKDPSTTGTENIPLNAIQVVELPNYADKSEVDERIMAHAGGEIQRILADGGIKAGLELEFYVLGQLESELSRPESSFLSEKLDEHLRIQRETAFDPHVTTAEIVGEVKWYLEQICQNAESVGSVINVLGRNIVSVVGDEEKINPIDYVKFMASVFLDKYIALGRELIASEPAVAMKLNKLANVLGYESLGAYLDNHVKYSNTASIVGTCAGHVSFQARPQEGSLQLPLEIVSSYGQLLTEFGDIVDAPTRSGTITGGIDLAGSDENVYGPASIYRSARDITSKAMATTYPPQADNFGDPNRFKQNIIDAITRGDTQTLDRAWFMSNYVAREGHKVAMPNMHSALRVRTAVSFAKFIDYKKGSLGLEDVTAHFRIESTSADATPVLAHIGHSIAMKKVLYLASLISIRDGYRDPSKWFSQVYGIDLPGKDDLAGRLDYFLQISGAVEEQLRADTDDDSQQPFETAIFDDARQALLNQQIALANSIAGHIQSPSELLELAISTPDKLVNIGVVINSLYTLSSEQLASLLAEKFAVAKFNSKLSLENLRAIMRGRATANNQTDELIEVAAEGFLKAELLSQIVHYLTKHLAKS